MASRPPFFGPDGLHGEIPGPSRVDVLAGATHSLPEARQASVEFPSFFSLFVPSSNLSPFPEGGLSVSFLSVLHAKFCETADRSIFDDISENDQHVLIFLTSHNQICSSPFLDFLF